MEQPAQPQEQPAQPQLCAAGCGFFANATLGGLCSKCYREEQANQEKAKAALAASAEAPQVAVPVPVPQQVVVPSPQPPAAQAAEPEAPAAAAAAAATPAEASSSSPVAAAEQEPSAKQSNRCQQCRKKVGLTGFKCKCGLLFCGTHRYAESHDCQFDYKSVEREKLAANNPLVQAAKVERI